MSGKLAEVAEPRPNLYPTKKALCEDSVIAKLEYLKYED